MSALTLSTLREDIHTAVSRLLIGLGRRHRLLRLIREQEAEIFSETLGLTVRSGPAAGLRLLPRASWGKSDIPGKVLGVYEQPIHGFLDRIEPFRRVVCVGAADGYYGIGLVVSGRAGSSVCYEMSEEGRKVIAATAALNGVAEKIQIRGLADAESLKEFFPENNDARELFLIDIEGAEYDLLTEGALAALRSCHVLIELHPHLHGDGHVAQEHLLARASRHFDMEVLEDGGRQIPVTPELVEMSDDQRSLMFSEGRRTRMQWLALTPRPAGGHVI